MMNGSFWRGFIAGGIMGVAISIITRERSLQQPRSLENIENRIKDRVMGIIQRRRSLNG